MMAQALASERRERIATAEVAAADPRALGEAAFRWRHGGEVLAAFGEVDRREGPLLRPLIESLRGGTWFGGVMFDPLRTRGPEWDGFAPARFSLPALLYSERNGRATLTAHGPQAQRRLDRARARLDQGAEKRGHSPSPYVRCPDFPARWETLISLALRHIRAGTLDKVVLARAIDVECDLQPEAVLAALEQRYPTCRAFLLRSERAAFVGATPELLCSVRRDEVFVDALAGSARPGEGTALLSRAKDLREHRWVTEHIGAALQPLCSALDRRSSPGLRELPNVVHLHTPFHGRLLPGRGAADVVDALHPTPAVGGVPVDAALQFIREYEGFDRGLYAGLVGFVSEEASELAVALRCALLRPGRARLFVGAGIVEGSTPAEEWAETELKAKPLLEALGA